MKIFAKILSVISFFAFVFFVFAACRMQLPESVSIKTKADYNFTITKIEKDFSDFFNPETIAGSFEDESDSESSEMDIYDYWPNKEGSLQMFLMKVPVRNISLDVSSSFDDLEIGESASNMSFTQEIKVPDIKEIDVEKNVALPSSVPESDVGIPINPAIELDVDDISFGTFSSDDSFEECIIEEGELSLELVTDDWEGTTVTWEEVTLTGGITLPKEKFVSTGNKCSASLKGVEFTNKDTIANIKIKLGATNAKTKNLPKIKGKCKINEIRSVKVKLPEGTETNISQQEPIDVDDAVKKIVLGDSKLICTYYNTMPDGNDFKLTCSSNFLGIPVTPPQVGILKAETPEENQEELIIRANNGAKGKTIVRDSNDDFPDVDFNAKFDFGTDDGFLVAKNVTPGEKYKIGVDVKIEFEWISMDVDTGNLTSQEDEVIDTGMDLSSMFKGIEESMTGGGDSGDFFTALYFRSLPLYVYCQTPDIDAFRGMVFTGDIVIGTSQDDVFTEYTENGVPKSLFKNGIKKASLPKLEIEDEVVVTNINTCPYSGKTDLEGFMKANLEGTFAMKTVNLGLANDLTGGNIITITKEQLDNPDDSNEEAQSCDIEIQAYIVIPLDFVVGLDSDPKGKIYYISNLFSSDEDEEEDDDIFGRDEPLELDTVATYLEVIKSVRMGVSAPTFPFKCSPKAPGIYIDFGNPEIDEKKMTFANKEYFSISGNEISAMLSTYPLKPKISFGFSKGFVKIEREAKLETMINIGVTTDGTIPLSALKGDD